jgi:hypothetical protein
MESSKSVHIGTSHGDQEWSDEPERYRPRPKPSDRQKRPLWKDPVVVIGAAVPILILSVFFGYLYFDRVEKEFEGRVTRLKIEADDLARSGESRTALEKYDSLLTMIEHKRFATAWLQAFKEYEHNSRDLDEDQRKYALALQKVGLADRLSISTQELSEILESTH